MAWPAPKIQPAACNLFGWAAFLKLCFALQMNICIHLSHAYWKKLENSKTQRANGRCPALQHALKPRVWGIQDTSTTQKSCTSSADTSLPGILPASAIFAIAHTVVDICMAPKPNSRAATLLQALITKILLPLGAFQTVTASLALKPKSLTASMLPAQAATKDTKVARLISPSPCKQAARKPMVLGPEKALAGRASTPTLQFAWSKTRQTWRTWFWQLRPALCERPQSHRYIPCQVAITCYWLPAACCWVTVVKTLCSWPLPDFHYLFPRQERNTGFKYSDGTSLKVPSPAAQLHHSRRQHVQRYPDHELSRFRWITNDLNMQAWKALKKHSCIDCIEIIDLWDQASALATAMAQTRVVRCCGLTILQKQTPPFGTENTTAPLGLWQQLLRRLRSYNHRRTGMACCPPETWAESANRNMEAG